jgi:hypothetical protein
MEVYIFNSRSQDVRALTLDRTGDSLPVAYKPWHPAPNDMLQSGKFPDAVVHALRRDGFFLTSGISRVVDRGDASGQKLRRAAVGERAHSQSSG